MMANALIPSLLVPNAGSYLESGDAGMAGQGDGWLADG
jgi:hypothetical protein